MATELLQQASSKRAAESQGKVSVRGITLKEYFRLCSQEEQQLNAIQEESVSSSKSSLLQTPSFQQHTKPSKEKQKFRTQANDQVQENRLHSHLPLELHLPQSNRTPLPKNERVKDPPQVQPRRRIFTKVPTHSHKQQLQVLNRSMGGFFQMEQKQRRMLKKVQADRDKAHEMNLKEALSITKYGTRFNVDPK